MQKFTKITKKKTPGVESTFKHNSKVYTNTPCLVYIFLAGKRTQDVCRSVIYYRNVGK